MPRTKFESVVFTAMVTFFMVYLMTAVSVARNLGGLEYSVFLTAIKDMWIEYAVVFVLIFFVISRFSRKLTGKVFEPAAIFSILATQCFTVCQIVPVITLFATFYHEGFTAGWFTDWIMLAFRSFPIALLLQIFYVGPLARFIFRRIFRRKVSI